MAVSPRSQLATFEFAPHVTVPPCLEGVLFSEQRNPNFSNLQGKRKLVRKVGGGGGGGGEGE